jgi:AhpD family alkylhydroperoxidase
VIRHVTPVRREHATGVVARVYAGLEREFGIHAEPITLHSPAPELLAGAWMLCREVMVADGTVDRAVKEALAISVSEANRCPYCVDAHSAMLSSLGGATAPQPPFAPADLPELAGTAMLFHYINRPVTIFLDESPLPTRRMHGLMVSLAGRRFRRFTNAAHPPGETLDLLPPAELPPDLAWAAQSPHVAGALARFAAAVERAGAAALPEQVRAWLDELLSAWDGSNPGPGSRWIDEALAQLDAGRRAAGRLALLAALAPYRVEAATIRGYGAVGDAQLVAAVAWSSFAAARRVAAQTLVPAASG